MNDMTRTMVVVGLGFAIGITTFLSFGWAGPIALAVGFVLFGKFWIMRSKFHVIVVAAGAILIGAYVASSLGWGLV